MYIHIYTKMCKRNRQWDTAVYSIGSSARSPVVTLMGGTGGEREAGPSRSGHMCTYS